MMGWIKWAGAGILAAIVALGYAMRIGRKLEEAEQNEDYIDTRKRIDDAKTVDANPDNALQRLRERQRP